MSTTINNNKGLNNMEPKTNYTIEDIVISIKACHDKYNKDKPLDIPLIIAYFYAVVASNFKFKWAKINHESLPFTLLVRDVYDDLSDWFKVPPTDLLPPEQFTVKFKLDNGDKIVYEVSFDKINYDYIIENSTIENKIANEYLTNCLVFAYCLAQQETGCSELEGFTELLTYIAHIELDTSHELSHEYKSFQYKIGTEEFKNLQSEDIIRHLLQNNTIYKISEDLQLITIYEHDFKGYGVNYDY